ncbi:unnamed protein product [Sympodiomycopsis kandeliae]
MAWTMSIPAMARNGPLQQMRLPPTWRSSAFVFPPTTAASMSSIPLRSQPSIPFLATSPHPFFNHRQFHTSPSNRDHYQTLQVERSASMKDIKNSFYALSKKYHPDVNRNDEGAKKKFQDVSEAWSILGDEKNKREYDRQLRYGSMGRSGSYSSGMAPRSYDGSDNTSRRARASYAWDYQRKRGDTNRSARASSHKYGAGAESRASSTSSQSESQRTQSLFEELAARQRRRENYMNAREAASGASTNNAGSSASTAQFSPSEEEHEAQTGSAWLRFFQMFTVIATIAFGASFFSGSITGNKYRAEGCEDVDTEHWSYKEERQTRHLDRVV